MANYFENPQGIRPLVFTTDRAIKAQILSALCGECVVCEAISDVEDKVHAANVLILASGSPGSGSTISRMVATRKWKTPVPLVAVLPFLPDDARQLSRIAIDEVIWVHEIIARLPDAVSRLALSSLQARLASALGSSEHIPSAFRQRLVNLCLITPPPPNLAAACGLMAESRAALRRKLKMHLKGPASNSVGSVLDWLRLLWICDPTKLHWKEEQLARALRRHRRSLQRTCRRLVNLPLDEARRNPLIVLHLCLRDFGLGWCSDGDIEQNSPPC